MATTKSPIALVCSFDPSKLEKVQMKGANDHTNTKESLFAIAPGDLEILLAGIIEFKKVAAPTRLNFSATEHYRNFPRLLSGSLSKTWDALFTAMDDDEKATPTLAGFDNLVKELVAELFTPQQPS